MARALEWDRYRDPHSEYRFRLPETTVATLAAAIRQRLGAPTLRVVGDPNQLVTRVTLVPGAAPFAMQRQALQQPDVDVVVIGEAREWETVEYAADAVTAGRKQALIVIGHIPSEQAGMEEFARWLRTVVKEVPVSFVPAADPFWAPR
jgi:putative NIF3 family GTP cyclohydrolase 1 type 2